MNPRVHKWLDLLDRAGWTAIQAAAAAGITFLTNGAEFSWQALFTFVGIATAVAVLKVVIGQNTGSGGDGSLIGTPVIEPPAQ